MTPLQKIKAANTLCRSISLVADNKLLPKIFVVNGKCYWFLNAAKRAAFDTKYPVEILTIEEAVKVCTDKPRTLTRNSVVWDFDQRGETFGGYLFCDNPVDALKVKMSVIDIAKEQEKILKQKAEEEEKQLIIKTIAKNKGVISKAAAELRISRYSLDKKIAKYNIERVVYLDI